MVLVEELLTISRTLFIWKRNLSFRNRFSENNIFPFCFYNLSIGKNWSSLASSISWIEWPFLSLSFSECTLSLLREFMLQMVTAGKGISQMGVSTELKVIVTGLLVQWSNSCHWKKPISQHTYVCWKCTKYDCN